MRAIRLGALGVIAILGLTTASFAEGKVDWSGYLESPAERAAAAKKQAAPAKAQPAPTRRVAQKAKVAPKPAKQVRRAAPKPRRR